MCKFLFDVFPSLLVPRCLLALRRQHARVGVVGGGDASGEDAEAMEQGVLDGVGERPGALLMVACTTATWPARQSARHDCAARHHVEKM